MTAKRAANVSLRDYIEQRITDLEDRMNLRFDASEAAALKAEQQMTARLDSINGFRATLSDQAARFVTRDELTVTLHSIIETVDSLKTSRDILAGKASQASVSLAFLLAAIGLAISLFGILG